MIGAVVGTRNNVAASDRSRASPLECSGTRPHDTASDSAERSEVTRHRSTSMGLPELLIIIAIVIIMFGFTRIFQNR